MRRYLTHAEVAHALGVTPQWLYRNKRRLEREYHFPAPAPGMRGDGGNLYDPRAITLWQDAQLPAAVTGKSTIITLTTPPIAVQPDGREPAGEELGDPVAELLDRRARDIAAAGRHH